MSEVTVTLTPFLWECLYCGGKFRSEAIAAYHFNNHHCEVPWGRFGPTYTEGGEVKRLSPNMQPAHRQHHRVVTTPAEKAI